MNDKTETRTKILLITPTLECGGAEKFVSLFCNHINTQQFSVCLVVVNNARPFYTITNPAIEIIDLKKDRVLFSLYAIKTVVKKYQPAVIFSTANHLNVYLGIFRNRFNKGIKFIARESSIVSINSQRTTMPKLYNSLVKKYYRRFDHIICQSTYMQQDLCKNYNVAENKTSVIHNATAENSNGRPAMPADDSGKQYKFITVGRLSEEKGIERLVHAVGLLSMPFQYFIIGDGIKKNDLQKLINELQLQDKIFLAGEKTDPFSGMEDADLFLIGSYYEGFPNVLAEAGVLGIPAIAFRAPGGIAEIIEEGENGILVDDNDLLGYATAIKKGVSTNFNRQKITETTKKRFSIEAMMAKLEALLLQS
jgi:glycosyltransferase involved in cell wall biosynthesis